MQNMTSDTHHVSFRGDVVFGDTKMDGLSARTFESTYSGTSEESSLSTSQGKYSKLRSNLTREQTNRDPFFFYQVTRNLGSGSMGDVKLVKKRDNRVGGSARRDMQEAVRRQKREEECLNLPVVGNFFQFCIDGNLKDEAATNASSHSFLSFHSVEKEDPSVVTPSRSFEDSLLNDGGSKSEIIYAMKSIHLDQVARREFIDELRNEIEILKDLDHPNIVRAIETFEFKGKISIVMEVCSGGDLYARDPYSEAEAARITGSILSAIAYMHSRNVVHRDLKYENVLFVNTSPMSPVKLIDFGLSKVYVDKKLTDISGTICTMAPEVILGQHTEKADMWSIGECEHDVSPLQHLLLMCLITSDCFTLKMMTRCDCLYAPCFCPSFLWEGSGANNEKDSQQQVFIQRKALETRVTRGQEFHQ